MTALESVTDWTKLTVTGAAFTRRGNVLYLKAEELGDSQVSWDYDGTLGETFVLRVIN